MRRFVTVALATAALAAAPAGAAPASPPAHAIAAKSCSTGFTAARINGAKKCLRAGEFCAHRYDHRAPHHWSYEHYGYACKKRDARGNYHLTHR